MKVRFFIYGVLEIILLSCIRQSEEGFQVLNVDINSDRSSYLEQNFEIEKIIPLDSTFPIGSFRKVLFYEDNYYLLDKSSDEIFCFNENGHLSYRISDKGKGPNEYIFIQNFYIDPFNKQIKILSGDGRILAYSLSGIQIRRKKERTNFVSIMDAVQLSCESEALYGLGPKYNLFIGDSTEKNYFIPFIEERDMSFSDKAFSVEDGHILFCQGMNDSIYEISSSKNVEPKFYVDFGTSRIDPELYLTNPRAVEKMYDQKTIASKIDNLNETSDFLLFSYFVFDPKNKLDVKKQFVMYEKRKKNILNFQNNNSLFPIRDIIHGKLFISVIYPVQIISADHRKNFEEILNQYINKKHLNEQSNPIIVIWKIKNA